MIVYGLYGYSYECGEYLLFELFSTKEKVVKYIEEHYENYIYDPKYDTYECDKDWDTRRLEIRELTVL